MLGSPASKISGDVDTTSAIRAFTSSLEAGTAREGEKAVISQQKSDQCLPLMIDIKDSFAYWPRIKSGKNIGNTATAHLAISYIRRLKVAVPQISNSDIMLIAPYKEQRELYWTSDVLTSRA